jgi:hypothetical protein
MSTFADIKSIRLIINDPAGLVDIDQCSDEAHLPAAPAPQVAFQSIATGRYYVTQAAAPVAADWTQPQLYLSDTTLGDLFDSWGHDEAVYRSLRLITTKLGQQMRLSSISSGTESTSYTSLKDLYDYYRQLMLDWKQQAAANTNTQAGQYGHIKNPTIAGGNV